MKKNNNSNGKITLSKDGKELKFEIGTDKYTIEIDKVEDEVKLSNKKYEPNKLLGRIEINALNFCYFTKPDGTLYVAPTLNRHFVVRERLIPFIGKKNIYFFGLITDISNRIKDFDHIYFNDKKTKLMVKRPLRFWKFKNVGIIKIPKRLIDNSNEIHNVVNIGDNDGNYVSLRLRKRKPNINYYRYKKWKIHKNDFMVIIRSTINGNSVRITKIPMEKEYTFSYRFKDFMARLLSKFMKKNKILMFEKYSSKASESGWYVFTKLLSKDKFKKKVFFILDNTSADWDKAHNEYPNNVIKKYSFKHYLYIYTSRCFISSELSNHVINPRLYLYGLNRVIQEKPLVFLQHGIMFAKPVDNPAAEGFYKDKSKLNIYKSVISSDLEATQFYKMGYDDADLIKCGLPKFDISYANKDAKDIFVMLTYRYWEEGQATDGESLKNTTYYKAYKNIIESFKKHGLTKNLKIAGHPKFMNALIEAMPEYKNIIVNDINEGLKDTKIFITDYSSASYDAHYRGAYIIYYWAERDYLIENYQAIPPINEDNCDGVPVFSVEELSKEVENAIKKNYVMDKKYEDRYKKINEFHDNNNAERLIEALKKDIII